MKQLDVLFVHANASHQIYQDLAQDFSAIEPPIWAGLLANHCRLKWFSVDILDCEALHLSEEESAKRIAGAHARLVCFVVYGQQPSASSQNMAGATSLADAVKRLAPEAKILFVGGHVAALPREVLQRHSSIDFVCQNEGVYTISNLLRTNLKDELHKVDGLGFRATASVGQSDRQSAGVILNKPSAIVAKADLPAELPGIAWDLLPFKNYRTALWHSYPNNSVRQPFAALYTSLGCPMKCSFCMINIINRQENEYSDGSAVFRYWEPQHIIKEFDHFASQGITNIKIADELFVLRADHFLKLCELIIQRGYKFNIWCYSRVDTVKDQYLDILKKAGVNWLALGIESGNSKVRKDVTKGRFDDVDIRGVVAKIRDHGINVIGNYIFGLPEDDLDSMQMTLDLAMEMNTEEANFYSAMAYPGSPLYGLAKKEGWKLPSSYAGFSQHSYEGQPLPTKYLSAEQVLAFRDEAWMKYHTSEKFLGLLKQKFGTPAVEETLKSTRIKLKRKILEGISIR
ncbi:MAG: cobalamin-dependent protein [Candidatus Omnitrophica bacterium]|nr:cobalamin-dependent protein [Candidatus Omnitrophota bacterium]MDE2214705.1 cobalamin-dependent protein [Candidatus Omnitrophota bacterium]MDE2232388.1 cobalamin-dependent protein [Candidatus Omnitrophota bacterium]